MLFGLIEGAAAIAATMGVKEVVSNAVKHTTPTDITKAGYYLVKVGTWSVSAAAGTFAVRQLSSEVREVGQLSKEIVDLVRNRKDTIEDEEE